jgi:DNA-directed RNA polymerase specialized sigma24 family protein
MLWTDAGCVLEGLPEPSKTRRPGRFAPWLYRIAHNEAYSMFRKRRPESDVEEIEPERLEAAMSAGQSDVFPIELGLASPKRSTGFRRISARRWC